MAILLILLLASVSLVKSVPVEGQDEDDCPLITWIPDLDHPDCSQGCKDKCLLDKKGLLYPDGYVDIDSIFDKIHDSPVPSQLQDMTENMADMCFHTRGEEIGDFSDEDEKCMAYQKFAECLRSNKKKVCPK